MHNPRWRPRWRGLFFGCTREYRGLPVTHPRQGRSCRVFRCSTSFSRTLRRDLCHLASSCHSSRVPEARISDPNGVRAFITDHALQRRLAKYMALQCFRNSMLEDLHAGTSPSSTSGDYSDGTVSSPYGAIPWSKVSRLNDDEMKRLMIDVVDRTYRFIHMLFDENTGGQILLRLAERDPLPQWNEPTLSTTVCRIPPN